MFVNAAGLCRYFQYKQLWDMFKLPGENDRKALRWEIKVLQWCVYGRYTEKL